MSRPARARSGDALRPSPGDWLQLAGSLTWLVQAGILASAVQRMAADPGDVAAGLIAAACFLLAGVLRAGCDAWGARLSFQVARRRLSTLRATAVDALANGSPLDKRRPAAGHAASVLAEQADAALPYLARYPAIQLKILVVPLAILAAVAPLSWVAALVLLASAPLIPVFMALVGWRAQRASQAHLAEMGTLNAFLLDRLRGLATLRALDAVDATTGRLAYVAQTLRTRTMAVLRIAFLSSAVLELFSAIGVAMVAVYVGFHLLGTLPFGTWGSPLALGQGLFVLLLAPSFFEPLRDLSTAWHDRAAGRAALEALRALSSAPSKLVGGAAPFPPSGNGPAHRPPPAVELVQLRFAHADAAPSVIDGLDLRVAPGERVAIMGPSGAGKSTLLALIAGLVPAQSGAVVIDGVALDDQSAPRLRARMAWIGQKPHVFAGTLGANVALGRPDVSVQAVGRALEAATLGQLAGREAGRPLGESGIGLSGGECLRLAMARAAAAPGSDLWLADEPTAHLDAATARELTRRLLAESAGRTLIVATHDPELAARMDRVIDLAAPRLAPAGTEMAGLAALGAAS
ncbi:thiol reductant ABC exporter subunit CydD [Pigmentiphaga sp. YJ18]|uniref:thiol reductant ABC exporter subunit CydD n=1 Tax=Pigmentiphaga sp. YJ18 TaxID=3134907 RepID=UPI00310E3D5B